MLNKANYGNLEILKNVWLTQSNGSVGIVKCRDVITNKIRYFVGMCSEGMADEWTDICWIIDNGAEVNLRTLEVVK